MNKQVHFMLLKITTFAIAFCVVSGLVAFDNAPKTLVFTTCEHNFGEIPFDGVYQYDFLYKNASSEPLIIDNVRTTCGCTAPTWSEEPIAPNEKGELNIEFTPRTVGLFEKKIKIYLHRIKKPIVLTITGEVI